jgi:hypothetical protein
VSQEELFSLIYMSTITDSLYRVFLRLAGGRANWHRRFYRPGVAVVSGGDTIWFEEDGFRLEAIPLSKLVGSSSGRCNVWLSGPSVKAIQHPSKVAQHDWMGVNGSPGMFGQALPRMRFYHVNDTSYIQANRDDFFRYAAMAEFTIVDYRAVFELLAYRDSRLSDINLVVYDSWAYPLQNGLGEIEALANPPRLDAAFLSKDAHLGLPTGGTVAYTGAQILALAGYQQIFFYGLDLSNSGRSYAEKSAQPQMLDKALQRIIIPSFRLFKREWPELACFNCNPESMLPEEVMHRMDADRSLDAAP